jgi:hypothetical protein
VRLWTHCPFDQYRKIRCRDTLDALPYGTDGLTRSDQRRGAVGAASPGQAASVQPFDLEDQRRNMRGRIEQLARPPVEQPGRFEDGLDARAMMRCGSGHVEGHDLRRRWGRRIVAQDDRARPDQQPELFFEPLARARYRAPPTARS